MRALVLILLALGVAAAPGRAQPAPRSEGGAATGWIRPEEVPARSDALRRRLDAAQPGPAAQTALEHVESGLRQLGPDLDAPLEQATAALGRRASFLELEDLRRQLTAAASPLGAWEEPLVAETKRVEQVLDDIAREQRIWSETRRRSETAAAGARVEQSVQTSLAALDEAAASLQAWRARVLSVSERVSERRAAVDATLDRLRAAADAQRANLLVAGAPLWQRGFGAELRRELPRVPEEIRAYARGTRAYVARDPRPLVVQVLLAVLLMFGIRRLSARARERLDRPQQSSRPARPLERPYAVALLFAFLATPALHPLAPRQFTQLLATVALLPAASFLLVLAIALGLGFWLKRRLHRAGDVPRLRRAADVAMVGLALALLAELGGWTNLATLLGRGIVAGAVAALYVYAAVIALEPLLIYVLTSPTLRRSHLFERNTAVVRHRVERGLRWLGAVLWLYIVLQAVGLRSSAGEALRALLQMGVSVGALSLSIGAVLAFVLTLLAALLLARVVNAVLEEDVYPRTSLPRGIPHALSTLVRYGVFSLGFLLALSAAGVQLSQLTILLGGFGVGIGLGLQDLVKNFAAGLTLLFERRVHVGDTLQIPSQEIFGHVLSIGMRATVVRSWNGSEVVVPNADLVSGAVTNWTLSDRLCRIEVPVGVAYGTDPERVVALLLEVTRSIDRVLAEPPPQALFKGFGDSSLDFLVRVWTDEGYERMAALTSEVALAVHRSLDNAGITIPFPQRDLHIASVSPAVRAAWSARDHKE
jgi:potassium efflux system protein